MSGDVFGKIAVSLIIFLIVIILSRAIIDFSNNSYNEEQQILSTLNRGLVQCYALEGSFPDDIYYLEKYGIIFNNEKYYYHYEPFGDRIPSISLIKLTNGDTYFFGGGQ